MSLTEILPVRFNLDYIDKAAADAFAALLKSDSRFALKSAVSAEDKCQFDRYYFVRNKRKVSVVYDTIANKLSLTAFGETMDELKALLFTPVPIKTKAVQPPQTAQPPQPKQVHPQNTKPPQPKQAQAQTAQPPQPKVTQPQTAQPPQPKQGQAQTAQPPQPKQAQAQTAQPPQPKQAQTAQSPQPKQAQAQTAQPPQPKQAQAQTAQPPQPKQSQAQTAQPQQPKQGQAQTAQPPQPKVTQPQTAQPKAETVPKKAKKPLKKISNNLLEQDPNAATKKEAERTAAVTVDEGLPEYKNGFSVRKCSSERLDAVLKRIRDLSDVTVKVEPTAFAGTVQEVKSHEIIGSEKQKLKLRYTTQKQTLQLQGKRCNLFGEIQVILSSDSSYSAAVSSHIELTGEEKRAGDIQRQLKKLLPDAFLFLSEQSKIDLSIGMIDINSDVRLSDYSVLLVPPYRGLERLIFDLQTAQNITVKMIGQAYEKDDEGHYLLKSGYRKKINSLVYAEVMSALYTEYFARRNFYAHSDNSMESQVRRIEDKTASKVIFDNLCKTINYNCKKLKEIGFAIKESI